MIVNYVWRHLQKRLILIGIWKYIVQKSKSNNNEQFDCHLFDENSFPTQFNLNLHLTNHIVENKNKCPDCNSIFYSNYTLKKHMKRGNFAEKVNSTYKCGDCDSSFTLKSTKKQHMNTEMEIQSKPVKCVVKN